jgi:TM2 domain-containing membrane protein YozV
MALKPCDGCGREIDTLAAACPGCGRPRDAGSSLYSPELTAEIAAVTNRMATQRHGVPALLSFFVPGLGQIVKGQFGLGLSIMVIEALCVVLCFYLVGFALLPIVWMFQLYNAYVKPDAAVNREAERVNAKAVAEQVTRALNARSP